jgi:streptomycin 3"-adenylyltransferase
MQPVVAHLVDHLCRHSPGHVVGLYLYGSATAGGMRPDSDIDLLLVTRESLTAAERSCLTQLLLAYSGRRAVVGPGRPVELTAVRSAVLRPWRYPPVRDYQYGEWLRTATTELLDIQPEEDPDLAILLTSARAASRALIGPPLAAVCDAIPRADLRASVLDCLGPLLADLRGDERNVLLTLARMVVTVDTGRIVSKDRAAELVLGYLEDEDAGVLDRARLGYLGLVRDEWGDRGATARTAAVLAARIRAGADRAAVTVARHGSAGRPSAPSRQGPTGW